MYVMLELAKDKANSARLGRIMADCLAYREQHDTGELDFYMIRIATRARTAGAIELLELIARHDNVY